MKTPVRVYYALLNSMLIITVLTGALAGCGGAAQATPTPTKTPRPDVSAPAATAEVIAQPTQTPTDAPLPTEAPTETPEPPTATPEPTATSAPTAAPAASGPNTAPPAREAGVSIFTGLRPADPAVLERRPLAIKIPNEQAAIPQSGLSLADVVVESRVEFCMTRYTVIFQSNDVTRVGNIRSARLIDVELPVIFDAILAFSGGVEPVRQKLYQSDIGDHILEQVLNGPSYFRDTSISAPHNLFANTATLWNTATQRGWNKPPEPSGAWAFSESAPSGGLGASRVDIPYPEFKVYWTYNAASGRWLRFMRGEMHVDRLDGRQLSAADVVIISANHVQTLIPESGTTLTSGACSNQSIEIQLWGQGPLKVLRDGKVYEGKWVRANRHAPFRFLDAQGRDIPLKPGNSWWQVVPLDLKVTVTP